MLLLLLPALAVASPPPARTEVPIRLSAIGGVRRYGVPVMVNGRVVEAGLDTGSVGLRILFPALPPGGGGVGEQVWVGFLPSRNEVAGCIATAARKICAPAMVDTGAPSITIFGGTEADLPPQGTETTLELGDRDRTVQLTVTAGRRDQAAAFCSRPARPDAKTSYSFGIAPYLRWSILYDAKARTLGVLDRRGS